MKIGFNLLLWMHVMGVISPHWHRISHVHTSENDRGTPGRGRIDFTGIFAALRSIGYDRWLTIEAFGRGLRELAAVFLDPKQVYEEGFRLIRDGWAKAA
jgi:D-psicose/D-tagatose/L-ribulose 3-epimerase